MKRNWIAAGVAGVLLLTFGACHTPEPTADVVETPSESLYAVVDGASGEESPYASEYPAIDSTVSLPESTAEPVVQTVAKSTAASDEVRGVWISYLELADLLGNKTEKQFTDNMAAVFDNAKSFGLNTVIVQVRPFADALYDSDYFPWSYLITGTEGKNPGFDPLAIMVGLAKERNLRIEAWINPYRVRAAGNNKALSADNQAKKWIDAGSGAVIQYDGAISYNPASTDARKLIVNGIVEIVENYAVDGVHIDDYFYPSTDAAYDQASYTAYKNGGGKLALADWRRSNVETLIKEIYAAVKAKNPDVLFGISPQSSVNNNYSQQYLDVEKIAGSEGYCDYICPQIYFGYNNDAQPYKTTLDQWERMVKDSSVKLYVGLASYKIGVTDSWAGGGKNEWTGNSDLMKRMVADARKADSYQGFVLYRYDSIFNPAAAVQAQVQKEASNLKSIL